MAAYAYANKIGPRNLDCINNITVAVPFRSNDRGMYGENWNPRSWMRNHENYHRVPFPYPWKTKYQRWCYVRLDYEDAWSKLCWMLTTAFLLETITFVLPMDPKEYYDSWSSGRILSALDDLVAAKPFLEMHVVRMLDASWDPFRKEEAHQKVLDMLMQIGGVVRVKLAAFDKDGKWRLAPQPYVDKQGAFVQDDELDASTHVVDVLPDMGRMFGTAGWR
jgi:hypothetical protein